MCEPAHSVVQYPQDFDDTNLPMSGQLGPETRLKRVLGKVWNAGKRIGKFWHWSKMGSGHSIILNARGDNRLWVPEPMLYEGLWWEREFRVDIWPRPHEDGESAAAEYHEAVCMKNMSTFRRFLENSMRKSNRPYLYVERLVDYCLTREGRNLFHKKFCAVFGLSSMCRIKDIEKLIKVTMGFTRKRKLFQSHYSDDDKLWTT